MRGSTLVDKHGEAQESIFLVEGCAANLHDQVLRRSNLVEMVRGVWGSFLVICSVKKFGAIDQARVCIHMDGCFVFRFRKSARKLVGT